MTVQFAKETKQRGVALLIALFALLLLSAIGMGMMFSANTETDINANYREKQIAIYGAVAGAMEAKDRLTSAGDIPNPAGIPTSSAANVIYIINPYSGETVAPWDYNNKYYDSELCHEQVMGLTGTNGVQCPSAATSFPSGSSWYQVLDDSSSSYTGVFKFNTPLNYKWTRIQLKTNNATPYPVDGTTSNGGQVCWNGMNQIPLPAGYGPDCVPNGSITSITVTSGGTGYDHPTVTISAPPSGGTQATATASVCESGCPLSSISVTNGGSGYTSAPTVTIDPPPSGGTQATATATIVGSGSPITSLTQSDIGSPHTACWSDASIASANWSKGVTFTGNGGLGGQATVNVSSNYTCIYSIQFSGGLCSGIKGTNASINVSGDASFVGTVLVPNSGKLSQAGPAQITEPGSGLASSTATLSPTVTISGCTSVTATAYLGHTIQASPNGLTLTQAGGGYTSSPPAAFQVSPDAGQAPTVTANLGSISPGSVVSIALTNAGSGYTSAPNVTLTGGCGTGTPPPACTTNATAQAKVSGSIQSVSITNAGSGYKAPPTVTISGSGSGATATATISAGTYYSPVYLITSLGYSPAGARDMVQIEAAPAIRALNMPGALTLAGPQPNFGAPNSNNFMIDGTDHPNGGSSSAPAPAGCSTTTYPPHPSIGAYDNPNSPTSPTSVQTILSDIPSARATTNYPGLNASPDVQNVYGALGDQGTTPSGWDSIVSAISALPGATTYTGSQTDSSINLGSISGASPPVLSPAIDVVYGDLTMNGNTSGYGILVVTGTLTFKGNMSWNGIVLAIGQGSIVFSGGGSGTINGSVMVAKTKDSSGNELTSLGTPTLDWSGGGGNGIYYDHCYSDSMLSMIPMTVPASAKPLTILSIKTLSY